MTYQKKAFLKFSFSLAVWMGIFLISGVENALARIALPSVDINEEYVVPRSQIRTFIQKESIKEREKKAEAKKPITNEELATIPERYLPPSLKKRKAKLKDNLLSSDNLQKERKERALKIRIRPSKVSVKKKGRSTLTDINDTVLTEKKEKAPLKAKALLPEVELIEQEILQAGQKVKVEIEPGEKREIHELFRFGSPRDPNKRPLLKAYKYYAEGDYATAATVAIHIMSMKDTNKATGVMALYLLAHSLFQAGFYSSSLEPLIALANTKLRRSTIGMLAKAIERTRNDDIATKLLSKISLSQIPEQHRALYAFHLGRQLLNRGNVNEAVSAFASVSEATPRYPESQYFLGVIVASSIPNNAPESDWGNENSRAYLARSHFDEALLKAKVNKNEDIADLSRLALARLAYQLKQYNQAVFQYKEIPAESYFGRESMFETAWTLHQLNEFNRSLGRLHSLGSPYYEGRDLAELWLLRSLNYLKLCRFDEANRAANTFASQANVVVPDLKGAQAVLKKMDVNRIDELWSSAIKDWIKKAFLSDPIVQKDFTQSKLLSEERLRLQSLLVNERVPAKMAKFAFVYLAKNLERKRKLVGQRAQKYILGRLAEVALEYRRQKDKADFLKFEVYSQATKFPDALKRKQAAKLIEEDEFLPGVFLKGREILWRFNTEYWLDEIKGYDYFIPSECIHDRSQS